MTACRTLSGLTWFIGVVCCTSLWLSPALATTVYRCGQTYQDHPCEGAQTLTVDDSRDAQQRAQAKDVATAERRLAKTLADERRARDKSARPQAQAAGIPPPSSALPDPQPEPAADCGKGRGKSKKSKATPTVCGDAKVRYAVSPDPKP
jgi:hypothetical protein